MKQNKPSFHNFCVLVLSVLCLVIFSGCMTEDPLPKVPIPPNAKPAGEKWVRLGTYMSPETFPKTWSLWLSLVRKVDDATKETKNVYDVYYYHNHEKIKNYENAVIDPKTKKPIGKDTTYGHGCDVVKHEYKDGKTSTILYGYNCLLLFVPREQQANNFYQDKHVSFAIFDVDNPSPGATIICPKKITFLDKNKKEITPKQSLTLEETEKAFLYGKFINLLRDAYDHSQCPIRSKKEY